MHHNRENTFSAKLTHIDNNKLAKFDIINQKQAAKIVEELDASSFFIKEIQKKHQIRIRIVKITRRNKRGNAQWHT